MRHKKNKKILGRSSSPRTALLRTLCISLIEHNRIQTSQAKAKAVQKMVEPLITMGKGKNVATIRNIEKKLSNKKAALSIVNSIGPRFQSRRGGYTRITKIGSRKGDGSEQVILEFLND